MIPAQIPSQRPQLSAEEARQLQHVRDDLAREFAALPPTVVDAQVAKHLRHFDGAAIRSFVPVLVRRGAREELRHLL